MFCKYCGKKISDDSIFCEVCGQRVGSEEVVMPSMEPQTYNMNAQMPGNMQGSPMLQQMPGNVQGAPLGQQMPGNMQGAPMWQQMPGNINGQYGPEVYMPQVQLYMNNTTDDYMGGLYKPGGYLSNGINGQYAMGIGWIIDPSQIPDMNRPYVSGEVFIATKTFSEAAQIAITRSESWMDIDSHDFDPRLKYKESFKAEGLIDYAAYEDKVNRKNKEEYLWIVSQEGAIAQLSKFDDFYEGEPDVLWYVITQKRMLIYLPTLQSTIIVQGP